MFTINVIRYISIQSFENVVILVVEGDKINIMKQGLRDETHLRRKCGESSIRPRTALDILAGRYLTCSVLAIVVGAAMPFQRVSSSLLSQSTSS